MQIDEKVWVSGGAPDRSWTAEGSIINLAVDNVLIGYADSEGRYHVDWFDRSSRRRRIRADRWFQELPCAS